MQAAEAAHGAEAATPFPPFDASLFPSQLFWFALSFIALYLVMSRLVLPKIGGALATRAGTIGGDLSAAAQKSAEADAAKAAMEKAVAKARADARAMVDAARAEAQAKLNAEREAAEGRIAARIQSAEAGVETARQKALGEVPALAEGLARDIADRIAPRGAEPSPRVRMAAGDA